MRSSKLSKVSSILLIFALLLCINPPSSASTAPLLISPGWHALGTGLGNNVFAIAIDSNNNVYAGGNFIKTDPSTVDRFAKWDGTSWSEVGGGTNGRVLAIAIDSSNNVYIGGEFTEVGTTMVNNIAKWNSTTSTWSALGGGITDIDGHTASVGAIAIASNGDLYAGGSFDYAGGVTAKYIAIWSGGAWSEVGGGSNGPIYSLAIDGSYVYAGGNFTSIGGGSVVNSRFAKWDGSTWSGMGSGFDKQVLTIAIDHNNGDVYAGGEFTQNGSVSTNHIAKWNGTTWSALGSGTNGNVWGIAVNGSGNVYAGGEFTQAGGVSANYIAKWNSRTWSALTTGTNQMVWPIAMNSSGVVYAGGWFSDNGTPGAGGVAGTNHIARWVPLKDTTSPSVSVTVPANGATVQPTNTLLVTFNEDMTHDGDTSAANYADNYVLVEAKGNGFQTTACNATDFQQDTKIIIDSVIYDNHSGGGPFEATLGINGGAALPNGSYRLFICGTTSVTDLAGNEINGGEDTLVNFTVLKLSSSTTVLPQTGFTPGVITHLPVQPFNKAYQDLGAIRLEIPSLGIDAPIVGVPMSKEGWDLAWLGNQVGWLEGTTFPSWSGNSALTAHVVDANGQPGLFINLGKLSYGNEIIVHAWGQKYIYQVRAVRTSVKPNDVSIFKHQDFPYLTLITCKGYDEAKDIYLWRVVVQAVQVRVE